MQEAERYGGKKDIFGGKRMIRRVAKKDLEDNMVSQILKLILKLAPYVSTGEYVSIILYCSSI